MKQLVLKLEFDFMESVFLKTDAEQKERIVTDIAVRPTGLILYGLSCGSDYSEHYGFEITKERDVLKATNN